MRAVLEEFMTARMPTSGMAACAAKLPDGMVIHRCFNRWLQPAQVRQTLGRLAQGRDLLSRYQVEPIRIVWVFEHLRVHLGLRPDKACLALFLENRAELPLAEIEGLLDEFASLPAP